MGMRIGVITGQGEGSKKAGGGFEEGAGMMSLELSGRRVPATRRFFSLFYILIFPVMPQGFC